MKTEVLHYTRTNNGRKSITPFRAPQVTESRSYTIGSITVESPNVLSLILSFSVPGISCNVYCKFSGRRVYSYTYTRPCDTLGVGFNPRTMCLELTCWWQRPPLTHFSFYIRINGVVLFFFFLSRQVDIVVCGINILSNSVSFFFLFFFTLFHVFYSLRLFVRKRCGEIKKSRRILSSAAAPTAKLHRGGRGGDGKQTRWGSS